MIQTIKEPKMVKARKEHACDFCGKMIAKGEEYEKATYKYDGLIYDWHSCKRCEPYAEEALVNIDYNWEDGMSEQDFMDYMYQEHRDIARKWWGE